MIENTEGLDHLLLNIKQPVTEIRGLIQENNDVSIANLVRVPGVDQSEILDEVEKLFPEYHKVGFRFNDDGNLLFDFRTSSGEKSTLNIDTDEIQDESSLFGDVSEYNTPEKREVIVKTFLEQLVQDPNNDMIIRVDGSDAYTYEQMLRLNGVIKTSILSLDDEDKQHRKFEDQKSKLVLLTDNQVLSMNKNYECRLRNHSIKCHPMDTQSIEDLLSEVSIANVDAQSIFRATGGIKALIDKYLDNLSGLERNESIEVYNAYMDRFISNMVDIGERNVQLLVKNNRFKFREVDRESLGVLAFLLEAEDEVRSGLQSAVELDSLWSDLMKSPDGHIVDTGELPSDKNLCGNIRIYFHKAGFMVLGSDKEFSFQPGLQQLLHTNHQAHYMFRRRRRKEQSLRDEYPNIYK